MPYNRMPRTPRNRVKLDLSEAEASLVLVALSSWRDNIMATAWDLMCSVVLRKQITDQLTFQDDLKHVSHPRRKLEKGEL